MARGIGLSQLETRIRIRWDPFVFLHLRQTDEGDLVNQFRDLEIELVVDGENLTESDRTYLQASVRRSAVYNLFTLSHRNTPVVEIKGRRSHAFGTKRSDSETLTRFQNLVETREQLLPLLELYSSLDLRAC